MKQTTDTVNGSQRGMKSRRNGDSTGILPDFSKKATHIIELATLAMLIVCMSTKPKKINLKSQEKLFRLLTTTRN